MKTKNRSAHSGLTATRFADYAYRLPGFDAESNVVYRADERRGFPEEIRRKRKVLFKVFDFKQIIAFVYRFGKRVALRFGFRSRNIDCFCGRFGNFGNFRNVSAADDFGFFDYRFFDLTLNFIFF